MGLLEENALTDQTLTDFLKSGAQKIGKSKLDAEDDNACCQIFTASRGGKKAIHEMILMDQGYQASANDSSAYLDYLVEAKPLATSRRKRPAYKATGPAQKQSADDHVHSNAAAQTVHKDAKGALLHRANSTADIQLLAHLSRLTQFLSAFFEFLSTFDLTSVLTTRLLHKTVPINRYRCTHPDYS